LTQEKKKKDKQIIKRIIFALFLLQIIKFEEIKKNCSYIIVYNNNIKETI